ncbi:MAG: RHS repeat-associated core domain-containing protein, partial [Clostridia bacterium]|nr:RHS repeat-associated core domain-containing protein [Clostridia bacterium]
YNPWGYCGEYRDKESGLIYLRNRYYDSSTGRFMTEDTHWNVDNMIYGDRIFKDDEIKYPDIMSMCQSINLYGYCFSNPVNYYDKKGNSATGTVSGWVPSISEVDGPLAIADFVALVLMAGAIVIDGVTYTAEQIDKAIEAYKIKEKEKAEAKEKEYEKARDSGVPAGDHKVKKQKNEKDNSGLERTGDPNSSTDLYDSQGNLKQRRYYGSDGYAEKDIDYSHANGNNSHEFPHEHYWVNGSRSK